MNRYCVNCMEPLGDGNFCASCGFGQSGYHAEAHQLSPGTLLRDRYVVGRVLGEGGFGITYVGKDIILERKVAVKEFYMSGYVNRNNTVSAEVLASVGTQGETFEKNKEKFLTEARVLAKFDDEGIVNIRDFFQENNTAYIVMDFLSGETLKDYVKRVGRLTAEEIVNILEPVFHSLTNVHNHDLIHRDISPDNIMLTDDGKVKLLDFGAAREVSKADVKSLSIILKPGYAPEEQYRSRGQQGPWTDIYALCATMYRCITGIVPDDAMERMFSDDVVPPAQLDCGCSPAMSAVIMKGLSLRAADRFQNIPELWEAICAAEENPGYVAAAPAADPDEERTVYSAEMPVYPQQADDATVYAGASSAPADEDATVYSGHGAVPAAPVKTAAPKAAPAAAAPRSERFQRHTDTASRRPMPAAAPGKQAARPAQQPQPVPQAAQEQPVKKKKDRLGLILGIAAGVLAVAGLGFLFGKGGDLLGKNKDGQQTEYREELPDIDRGEMSERLGGSIDVLCDGLSTSLPVEMNDLVKQGYSLVSVSDSGLPQQLQPKETCEAVLIDEAGNSPKFVCTLQNFLTQPAAPEDCVIVGLSTDALTDMGHLTITCETPSGTLWVTDSTDLDSLEENMEELSLSWEKETDSGCWRVYLTAEQDGAYLEFRFDEDGFALEMHIFTGHVVEEYFEDNPPVQVPVQQEAVTAPPAGGTLVTGMPYNREALVEQMGGELELYWNGNTMRLPATGKEFKEQGLSLDNWTGTEYDTTIPAGIQKTAQIDNEASDSGFMYIGVHNYTADEQPVDGCWIADVEVWGVQHYTDLQFNWWTPGGQFYLHGGMTADEVRQEAANNGVCVLPDDAVNSDYAEDMMLSVAEDGSLLQLVLFFNEDGTMDGITILMGHVYERYFEMHPEEAIPQTVSVADGDGISYDRNAMIEEIGGEIIVTHDGITTPFPISLGEMKAQGYGVTSFENVLPEVMEPNVMKDFRLVNPEGYAPYTQYAIENYASEAIPADFCMLTDALFSPWGDIPDMGLTWKTARGELTAAPGMYLEDVEAQMAACGLRWIPNDIESDQHTVRVMSMGEDDCYANVIFFFIPETEALDGIHVSIGGAMRSYFERHPEQALPAQNGPDYRVEEVRAAMGFEITGTWDGYSITLPMPAADYIAQGNTMQSMQFSEFAEPMEGFNAVFCNSAGMETAMMYWLSNFSDGQMRREHTLITEFQTTIEQSTDDLVVDVRFPDGTMTLSAGMTREEVEEQMAMFALTYSPEEPGISTRKIELMEQEGQAFLDVDFDDNGVLMYVRAWVDGYCAKYYSQYGLS